MQTVATMSRSRNDGTDENKRPDDIRNHFSPTRNTQPHNRRRRIVTSDSNDEQREQPAMQPVPTPDRNAAIALAEHVAQNQNVVLLTTSDDDSMYIPLPARRARTPEPTTPPVHPRTTITSTRGTPRPNATPRSRTPQGKTSRGGNRRSRPAPRSDQVPNTFEGEAEEASTDDDEHHTSECVESDTHGEDLYRQAIAGCRNATKARTQLRAATTQCRVCAKFAAYLDHFL